MGPRPQVAALAHLMFDDVLVMTARQTLALWLLLLCELLQQEHHHHHHHHTAAAAVGQSAAGESATHRQASKIVQVLR